MGIGRFAISDVTPVVTSTVSGEHPAKAVVGEYVPVSAAVFREGHDAVGASVVLYGPDGTTVSTTRMTPGAPGTDRWHATVVPTSLGAWSFAIEAWSDPLATWHHAVTVKLEAGQGAVDLANDLADGSRLFTELATLLPRGEKVRAIAAAHALADTALDLAHRVAPALEERLWRLVEQHPVRELVCSSPRYPIKVERSRAQVGSWYEFFPRSIGAELAVEPEPARRVYQGGAAPSRPTRHGTFKDAAEHLDYVASMGFDVVYLPPIHPIGEVNRKGPNNTLVAAAWDVGSPWAIGSKDGGHDAIHPSLGTLEEFKAFVARANGLGLEVALDLALQAAPDHPWVRAHPEWFTTRPDGSIAYAENPPKKYQDIYPLNFDNDPEGLYAEVLRVVHHWMDAGVRIFRVDNPHTKPFNFWQWLIAEVNRTDPDVVFLAEAFTRPAIMHELGKIGFQQSYTYFTWRNGADELAEYAVELVRSADHMRPNFFVNTPDILHEYLQHGGPAAFAIRAVLAATLSPTWGVYSGFELFEHRALKPGSEEYLDSEKYQLRPRDLVGAAEARRSLAPLLTLLNAIRREHPALRQLRELHIHKTAHNEILAFSKRDPETDDTVLVVCSTNPHEPVESMVEVDLAAIGRDWATGYLAHDLLTGADYQWGESNYVRLDPAGTPYGVPAHVLHLRTR
jgi:starch synthase (maltosyl-transferring)